MIPCANIVSILKLSMWLIVDNDSMQYSSCAPPLSISLCSDQFPNGNYDFSFPYRPVNGCWCFFSPSPSIEIILVSFRMLRTLAKFYGKIIWAKKYFVVWCEEWNVNFAFKQIFFFFIMNHEVSWSSTFYFTQTDVWTLCPLH